MHAKFSKIERYTYDKSLIHIRAIAKGLKAGYMPVEHATANITSILDHLESVIPLGIPRPAEPDDDNDIELGETNARPDREDIARGGSLTDRE